MLTLLLLIPFLVCLEGREGMITCYTHGLNRNIWKTFQVKRQLNPESTQQTHKSSVTKHRCGHLLHVRHSLQVRSEDPQVARRSPYGHLTLYDDSGTLDPGSVLFGSRDGFLKLSDTTLTPNDYSELHHSPASRL